MPVSLHRRGHDGGHGLAIRFERPTTEDIDMLGNVNAIANIPVRDLDAARRFYEGTLGLVPVDAECEGMIAFKSGDSTVYVYQSDYAGTNKATAMTWDVGDDVESVVRALTSKGVSFEHYDLPGTTRNGDVHVAGATKTAWFKDPDGNILGIAS
jgi:catechol 2,3-dioxygenase-like lactoylglutathione lyase family enzyme